MTSEPMLQETSNDLDYILLSLDQTLKHLSPPEGKGTLEREGIESFSSISDESEQDKQQVQPGNAAMERLQHENKELRDRIHHMDATISTYKEDFRKEREDRTKNIEKIVQLEARVAELQSKLDTIETKRKREDRTSREQTKELKAAKTSELAQVQAELEAAKEEIAVKVAQVKQYQKQVEAYKQAQTKNEFEQQYHEEKERNARLMEEIDKLKRNKFQQQYNEEKERNVRLMEEIDRLKETLVQATLASSSRREGDRSISSQQPQHYPELTAAKATTEPAHAHISHDSDDDLPPPIMLPAAHHPPNTVSHLPQSSRPIAYPVEAHQHHRVEADERTSLVDIPFDPNLVCPVCRKKFRKGEIQLYRQHVDLCDQSM